MQKLTAKYKIEIKNAAGSVVADLSGKASDLSFTLVRNRGGNATFTIDLDELEKYANAIGLNPKSLLGVGQHELVITRINRTLFSGQIIHYEGILSERKQVTVRAVGFFDLLATRFTSALKKYTATDAGAVAWDLIDTTQVKTNGSFGITQGSIDTSVDRTRTYEYKNIREAIIELSEVKNGFDFEVTHDKVFNVYYPDMGAQRDEFIFDYPGNIKEIRISRNATGLVNEVIARGQGYGLAQVIVTEVDSASQASFTLRQKIMDLSDIVLDATLTAYAQEEIDLLKDPLTTLDVTVDGNRKPFIGSYWIGDRIKIEIHNLALFVDINTYYRIDEITVGVDENESEDIKLKLSTV